MNLPISVNQDQLLDVLINVAIIRPVFIWGAPGLGKSAIVEQFAESLGLPCVYPMKRRQSCPTRTSYTFCS